MSAITANAAVGGFDAPAAKRTDLATPEGSKEVFLQLLVAQLKNQNPMNPADGVEFITQLTQFSQLEQLLGMRQDLGSIKTLLAPPNSGGDGKQDGAAAAP